ncbi:methyltransferase domain-containing protein [Alcaligenaceae bacterium]|nr:methyltransferase domain-containing protein [Alcaligenaceae bacterium]
MWGLKNGALAGFAAAAFLAGSVAHGADQAAEQPANQPFAYIELDVPYVQTPDAVVARMLELADVQPSDFVYDLGSGDGRIAIAAVRDRKAKGAFGVEIDPKLVDEAGANARRQGVSDRVKFDVQDLFTTDFSRATVVTMYLLPDVNLKLRPTLLDMPAGTRVVSHQFDMGDWASDFHERQGRRNLYLWVVPAKLDGKWTLKQAQGDDLVLELDQRYQRFEGVASRGGTRHQIRDGWIRGKEVHFQLYAESGVHHYAGRVEGDTIVPLTGWGGEEGWQARR